MVLAHHLIWVAYGWWLPNDPRGSMSHAIASDVIADLGTLHYGRKKLQPASRNIRAFHEKAKDVLKFPLRTFDFTAIQAIADASNRVISEDRLTCYAAALMPDHVHVVVRKHKLSAEEMIGRFQDASRIELVRRGVYDTHHPVWGGPGWKVFLDSPEDIRRTIPYVEENPVKSRLPRQSWRFVTPYDNWPFHKNGR